MSVRRFLTTGSRSPETVVSTSSRTISRVALISAAILGQFYEDVASYHHIEVEVALLVYDHVRLTDATPQMPIQSGMTTDAACISDSKSPSSTKSTQDDCTDHEIRPFSSAVTDSA